MYLLPLLLVSVSHLSHAQSSEPASEIIRAFQTHTPHTWNDLAETLHWNEPGSGVRGPVNHRDSTHVTDLFEDILQTRILYRPDERANDTLREEFIYQTIGADLLNVRVRQEFDDQSRVTFLLSEIAPEVGEPVEPSRREITTYQDDFRLYRTNRVDEFVDPQTPRPVFRYTRSFTNDGQTATFLSERFDTLTMDFLPISRSQYRYDDDGRLDTLYGYSFNDSFADSTLTSILAYTYLNDEDDSFIRTGYRPTADGSDIFVSSQLRIEYLPGTTFLRLFRYEFFNETALFFAQEVRYGYENGILAIDSLYQTDFLDPGVLLPQRVSEYIYNDMDLLVRQIRYLWDGDVTTPSQQLDHFYSTIDVVSVQNPRFQSRFECRLANPLSVAGTLNCDLPATMESLQLRVFDTSGRLLLDTPFRNGQSLALPSGNQVLALFSNDGQLQWRRRIVVLE